MLSTVYKDKQKGTWLERIVSLRALIFLKGNLIVQIKKDDKVKSIGIVKLNLIDFIDAAGKTEESRMGVR
jgi:hypothetical protein